jgi:phosphodiesterase/alkaline phosphatase D-like protein
MNQNILIGIIVVIVVLVGGYFIVTNLNNAPTMTTTSTSTASTQTTNSGGVTAATPGQPTAVTDTNVAPTNSTAVVTGKVTPDGAPTTYWYEFGLSSALGSKTSAQTIGSGFTAIASPGYITGLAANTTYYFRLDAQNSFGTVSGATYSFTTNSTPAVSGNPPAVSTNAVSQLTSTSADLNGHMNPRSSGTTYWFEYGQTPDLGNVTAFQSGGNGDVSIAVSATVTGLNPQTKYYFRIDAQNQYGTVTGSTQSFTTSAPTATTAPVVTTGVASPVATTTAIFIGTVNPYGAATTYWFEYSTNSNFGGQSHTTVKQSAGSGATTVPVQASISGLQPNTTYYFRVVAQNSAGTTRGTSQTLTTK